MEEKDLVFEVAHIGINCENQDEAKNMADIFSALFGFKQKEGNSSVFAGNQIELMKSKYLGRNGHIGIRTNDMDAAIKKIEAQGYEFDWSTQKNDPSGEKKAVYLREEIAGFAVHLLKA